MSKVKGPTRTQKARASTNSIYMTTFILLITLILGLPTGAYIYMANTHKPSNSSSDDKQVQKIEQNKLPKPKKATKRSVETTTYKNDTINSTNQIYADIYNSSTNSISYNQRNSNMRVSGTKTYTVKQGDNLYRIAVNHGMTQQELMNLNGLTQPVVSVGQVLQVK